MRGNNLNHGSHSWVSGDFYQFFWSVARCIVVGCAVALLLCLDITSTIPICSAKVWLPQRKCGVLVVGRKKTCCKLLSIRGLCCKGNSTGVGHDCSVFSSRFPKGTNLRSPPWKTGLNFPCLFIFSRDYRITKKSLQSHHSTCKGKFCGFKYLLRYLEEDLTVKVGQPRPGTLDPNTKLMENSWDFRTRISPSNYRNRMIVSTVANVQTPS